MAIDAVTQKKLYDETDHRFWSQTGYSPGHKLDPHDSFDASMMPVWQAIYAKVLGEYNHGSVHWTMDQPEIVAAIADAGRRMDAAAQKISDAAGALTGTPPQKQAIAQATAQHDAAQVRTKQAGAHGSPNVVDPSLVAQAAKQAPPPQTPAQVTKGMQLAAAPGHAHEVMSFHMDAGGHGMPDASAPGAVVVVPSDLPQVDAHQPTEAERHSAGKWTPLVALGAVGAALGLGTLITRAAGGGRPRRRSSRKTYVIAR